MIHRPLPNPDFDAGVPGAALFSDCQGCGEKWPCPGIKADTAPVAITGVGLWADSHDPEIVKVEVEIEGRWVVVIRQRHRPDDLLGATVEPLGIRIAARQGQEARDGDA